MTLLVPVAMRATIHSEHKLGVSAPVGLFNHMRYDKPETGRWAGFLTLGQTYLDPQPAVTDYAAGGFPVPGPKPEPVTQEDVCRMERQINNSASERVLLQKSRQSGLSDMMSTVLPGALWDTFCGAFTLSPKFFEKPAEQKPTPKLSFEVQSRERIAVDAHNRGVPPDAVPLGADLQWAFYYDVHKDMLVLTNDHTGSLYLCEPVVNGRDPTSAIGIAQDRYKEVFGKS